VYAPPIIVNSRWIRKQVPAEAEVTRVRFREVSYIAVDKSCFGRVPKWMFLQDFRPTYRSARGRNAKSERNVNIAPQ
jgi:hypothetical protein